MIENIPKASIIIRTKNEARLLPNCLEMILKQSIGPVEVIFVDSGSTDGSVGIIEGFLSKYRLGKLIRIKPEEFSYGRALNLGCELASGDILVSLSAHAIPVSPEWLVNLLKYFSDLGTAGVCAGPKEEVIVQTLDSFLKDPYFGFDNGNAAFRRCLWAEHRFNESMLGTEDKEWEYFFLQRGYRTLYVPGACVVHSHRFSFREVYKRSYREHHGFAQFLDKHATRRMIVKRKRNALCWPSVSNLLVWVGAIEGLADGYRSKWAISPEGAEYG